MSLDTINRHSLKIQLGVAISAILFVIGITFAATKDYTTVFARVDALERTVADNDLRSLPTLKNQIDNIEDDVTEIKSDQKEMQSDIKILLQRNAFTP